MNASEPASNSNDDATIRDIAARWVVRQDRPMTDSETAELQAWLSADPRHAAAFNRSMASWRQFRELGALVRRAPAPQIAPRLRWNLPAIAALAAAAAVAIAVIWPDRAATPADTGAERDRIAANADLPTTQALADGSVARLKQGAEIAVSFSASERRLRLIRGEAFFNVATDPARPFFVEVGEITVRAVGTAFAIQFESHAVKVLVTEGAVQVTPPASLGSAKGVAKVASAAALVGAGQRAVVGHSADGKDKAIVVTAVSADEIARTLAWNKPMLELAGATLGELVAAFAEQSGRRIEIGDPALNAVRIGGRFPTDDIDGFVRALEAIYEVKSERRPDGTIVLRGK